MSRQLTFSSGAHWFVIGFALLGLGMMSWAYLEIYDQFEKTGSILVDRDCRPKSAWFCEIDKAGGGYPGVLLLLSLSMVAVYGIVQSAFRIFGSNVAVDCSSDQLRFHPTVYRRGPVRFNNISRIWTNFSAHDKKFETTGFTFGKQRMLWLAFTDRDGKNRKVHFDANRIAGGRNSLIEFQRDLKTRLKDAGNKFVE